MKRIIVPVDFSVEALNAAYYASGLARHIHADILLIHFLPLPIAISEVAVPLEDYHQITMEAEASLVCIKNELSDLQNDKINIGHKVTSEGFLDYIKSLNLKDHEPFIMVMGAKGRSMVAAQLLGSFSLMAAKHLRHPLMIIPKECNYRGIAKIGLACDMKNVSATLPTESITALVKLFNASLDILYISDPNERMYPGVLVESKIAQDILAHLHPAMRISTNENVEDGLSEFSLKAHIDLLLVIPKERNFIQKLLIKSISHDLAIHPHTPVMLLHEEQNFCLL